MHSIIEPSSWQVTAFKIALGGQQIEKPVKCKHMLKPRVVHTCVRAYVSRLFSVILSSTTTPVTCGSGLLNKLH